MGIKSLGMAEILKGSERLNNYMRSVDTDLKKIGAAFNDNFINLFERLEKLEEAVAKLDGKLPGGDVKDDLRKTG